MRIRASVNSRGSSMLNGLSRDLDRAFDRHQVLEVVQLRDRVVQRVRGGTWRRSWGLRPMLHRVGVDPDAKSLVFLAHGDGFAWDPRPRQRPQADCPLGAGFRVSQRRRSGFPIPTKVAVIDTRFWLRPATISSARVGRAERNNRAMMDRNRSISAPLPRQVQTARQVGSADPAPSLPQTARTMTPEQNAQAVRPSGARRSARRSGRR